MDTLNKEKRSWIMSRIKSKGTSPELIVRSVLCKLGYKYRLNYSDLPGRPDIVLTKSRKIIFVHGCFWHGHLNCPKAKRPNSNKDFWNKKLNANLVRDYKNLIELKHLGWEVLVIWQCQIKNEKAISQTLKSYLEL